MHTLAACDRGTALGLAIDPCDDDLCTPFAGQAAELIDSNELTLFILL
jgi:hypothetical protein